MKFQWEQTINRSSCAQEVRPRTAVGPRQPVRVAHALQKADAPRPRAAARHRLPCRRLGQTGGVAQGVLREQEDALPVPPPPVLPLQHPAPRHARLEGAARGAGVEVKQEELLLQLLLAATAAWPGPAVVGVICIAEQGQDGRQRVTVVCGMDGGFIRKDIEY